MPPVNGIVSEVIPDRSAAPWGVASMSGSMSSRCQMMGNHHPMTLSKIAYIVDWLCAKSPCVSGNEREREKSNEETEHANRHAQLAYAN
ncbi:hypothetical protein PRIPAC_70922 [Pristionchus pacificus]|uniref:Uncharacterized protein n=1 Tax=Pristionchus pacificus TaxID=54126 RepID=A0A2A6BZZ8_PRIPA|nr:hypothetical protein PRIPAC_70922 [Pristionchus pacificus]|eukprot:PDM71505.1 hypothetical protein PRIPAC_37912 [Pristionchus pacificus]